MEKQEALDQMERGVEEYEKLREGSVPLDTYHRNAEQLRDVMRQCEEW